MSRELRRRAASIRRSRRCASIRADRAFSLLTEEVRGWLSEIGAIDGLLTLFIRHTSASLLIQENADPDVQTDLVRALDRLAPKGAPHLHTIEGDDDMPAHIKAALTATSLSIPVRAGSMVLGTWQAIYVAEHRDRPHPVRWCCTTSGLAPPARARRPAARISAWPRLAHARCRVRSWRGRRRARCAARLRATRPSGRTRS